MDNHYALTVNGRAVNVMADPRRPLLEVLREDLQLTGTKYGCGEGMCGACSVLVDGKRVFSCMTPVAEADHKSVTTIEGLAPGDGLHPVQAAFLAEGAFQCAYCTPGMVVATVALLKEYPNPSTFEIVKMLDGNLCRCGTYPRILKAVRRAAASMNSSTREAR